MIVFVVVESTFANHFRVVEKREYLHFCLFFLHSIICLLIVMLIKGFAVAAVLLLLPIFCNAGMYLDDPAFSQKTEYGMSHARSPTYDYQFDPEIFWGYVRQDNIDNGTSVGKNGFYLVTNNTYLYFRVDSRDCKQNKAHRPKSCVCYASESVKAANSVCDGKVMAHICLRETPDTDNTATYTTTAGTPSTISKLTGKVRDDNGNDVNAASNVESVHVVFNFDTSTGEVTATDFLGGGLHMAQAYTAYVPQHKFLFNTQSENAALPKFIKKYPFNKDFEVEALEIFFPQENDNCARLDYFGLAYADGLLFNTAKEANDEIVYYQPKKFEDRKEADKCSCNAKCPDMQ